MHVRKTIALLGCLAAAACENGGSGMTIDYPETRRGDTVDNYHGTRVADPYRWMENLESAEVQSWVAAQNAIAEPYLEAIPARQPIIDRLTALWNYERYSIPFKEGDRYFYSYNNGLQNHDVLYVTDAPGEQGRVLLDPNTFSEDGTVSLGNVVASPDGSTIAYSVSDGGSDWKQWRVRDVETGQDLPDLLLYTKFTGASWARDGSGFYYSRYPLNAAGEADGGKAVSVYYHALGTPQSEDTLVYSLPEHGTWNPYATVTEDGKYLVITIEEGYFTNAVHYMTLDEGSGPVVELLTEWDAYYEFLGNDGSEFYFKTTNDAPNGRVIAIDVTQPAPENWREVIPERERALEAASLVGGHIVAQYLEDARAQVGVFDLAGNHLRDVELPGPGSVGGFRGRMDDTETFFRFESFADPGAIWRYDVATGERELFRRIEVKA
ncbi:MAG TPA: S9 family peptidase, partial [Gammaproteobacteria bacterium]